MSCKLNLMELKKSLDSGAIGNLYIFAGEEYKILETYIDMICAKFAKPRMCLDSVFSLYKKLDARSLISSDNVVYVIRDDRDFITNEVIWKDLAKKLSNRKATLIVKYGSIDSRCKFYKHFSDEIVFFEKLSDSVLIKYIKKDLPNLSQGNCANLVVSCSGSYGKILLEIDKIQNICKHYNMNNNDAFSLCVSSGALHSTVTGQIFDLVNSIMERNYTKVFKELQKSKQRSDSPLAVLSLLHNNVKALLQVSLSNNSNSSDISKVTGLTPYQIKSAYAYINNYSCKELVRFIKYIKYCDDSVKKGILESESCLEYLLVNIL